MNPIYTAENTKPAYQLNWGLMLFWRTVQVPENQWLERLRAATEGDGVRILKYRITEHNNSQFLVSSRPETPPSQLIRSVKGRLQYLVRNNVPKAFQRNYALRSIGSAKRDVIESYVRDQLGHHKMADRVVQTQLADFQKVYSAVDLSRPVFSSHGQYWYNLHLVFVNQERWNETRREQWTNLVAMVEGCAMKYGHRLSSLSVLCDHVHLLTGCSVDESPQQIALSYLNNCAQVYEMKAIYRFSYYTGTFGECDRGAV